MKKIILFLSFCFFTVFGYCQYDLSKNVDKQVIMVPKKGMESLMESFINENDGKIVKNLNHLGWYVVLLPENLSQNNFLKLCKNFNFIQNVWKDEKMEMKLDYIPNDTEFSSCWYLKQSTDKDIDADEAWDLVPQNNPYVSVAMLDGGLDLTIPDLGSNVVNPFNAVNSTTSIPYVNIYDKHGTACSGTIAAITNNGFGVSSVGNNLVKVIPINIMSNVFTNGSFSTTAIIQINAVNAAIANPTCVAIAMSYGGSSYSSALEAAFESARTTSRNGKGMIVVASSGNGSTSSSTQYPANYSNVWGIGATNNSDLRASFSNFGQICDISAPGVSIRTTDRQGPDGYSSGDYTTISGTSFSCPIFAASAALCFYKNWELTDDQVLQIMSSTAEKVGGYSYTNNLNWPFSTRSNELGYGRINLKNAVNATPNPGGTPFPPPPPNQIHNFLISSLTINPLSVNNDSNIIINCTVGTQTPNNPTFAVTTQYRLSTNTVWGDSDDVIIGLSSSTLGDGISVDTKIITYNVGSSTGNKNILAKVNYMGSIVETNYNDNNAIAPFTIIYVSPTGTDAMSFFDSPTTPTVVTSQPAINMRFAIKNEGINPITSITYRRGWLNCPPVPYPWSPPCLQTFVWSGNLLTGQITYLPTPTGFYSINLCHSSNSCAISPGNTNTYLFELLTINGSSTDSNMSNNYSQCEITRLSTTSNNDNVSDVDFIEVRNYEKFYGVPLIFDSFEELRLTQGLNIVKIYYLDGNTEVIKISK
jgi:hypothetical protein